MQELSQADKSLLFSNLSTVSVNGNGTRANVPTCASTNPDRWAIDISTDAGKAMAAVIMSAFYAGKTLHIGGTGGCNVPSLPAFEQVSYVQILP